MIVSSSLLSPESALRFPSSLGRGQSKCRGRTATFMGAELSFARCLHIHNRHGDITQSHPQLPAWPQHWQVANGEFFEQKGVGETSGTTPTLCSTKASKQLSAGQEMGLNFVLAALFSNFPRGQAHHETFPICFLFQCNVPHILEIN